MIDKEVQNKHNFYIIALLSFPLFYIFGSLFLNLSIICIGSIFFFDYSKILNKKILIIIFSLILSFFLINSILSYDKIFSIYKSTAYLRYFFFTIGLVLILSVIKNNLLKLVSRLFLFLTIFFIIDIIFEYINGKDFFGNNDGARYNRLSGPFGDEWIAGFFLLYFGFISFGFISKFYNISKFFYFLFSIVAIYTIYLTGERNAFFSSLIFLSILILIDSKYRTTFLSSLLVILFLFILSNKYNVVKNKYSLKSINTLNSSNIVNVEEGKENKNDLTTKIIELTSKNQWIQHYISAYHIFRENLFFGSGFRSFKSVCPKNEQSRKYLCSSHPHNIYFELLSDVGIFGFLIFSSIFIFPIIIFFQKRNDLDIGSKIFFGLFITFIFPFKPHGSLFTTSYASMLWFLYALNIYFISNEKKK